MQPIIMLTKSDIICRMSYRVTSNDVFVFYNYYNIRMSCIDSATYLICNLSEAFISMQISQLH